MRILIIENVSILTKNHRYYTYFENGVFIKELKKLGHNISYYNFAIESEDTVSTFDLEEVGVKVYPLKYLKNKIINYIHAYIKLIPFILKHDFVYFYHPSSFQYGAILCKLLKTPYGVYLRGMQGVDSKTSRWIYKHATIVLTVSDFFTNHINNIFGKNKAETIRPMMSYSYKDIVLNRQYLTKKQFINVLFLGRIEKDKGLFELIESILILKDKYSFSLKIVGAGEYSKDIEQLIKQNNLESIVSIEGFVSDMNKKKEYYLNTDIYILPTYHEGFPRTLYEAMIFGTPIVTTFVGGISSLMKDNYNCKKIEPKSSLSIAETLEYAFNNYDKMIGYAKNGTETIKKIIVPNRLNHANQLNKILENVFK